MSPNIALRLRTNYKSKEWETNKQTTTFWRNQMEYQVKSQKLQDILTNTVRITAKVAELGAYTATTITIPLADLSADAIAATDVLLCNNHTDSTSPVPTVVGTNLILTDAAFAATDLISIIIRLK
jgi:collagenase-like PrtC family protease